MSADADLFEPIKKTRKTLPPFTDLNIRLPHPTERILSLTEVHGYMIVISDRAIYRTEFDPTVGIIIHRIAPV